MTEASVEDFIQRVEGPERRADCRTLVALMHEITGEPPRMWGTSIVGFGTYHYKYASGREGEWFLVGFSPRKRNLTLYLMGGLAALRPQLERLGKHSCGKGCLYLKRLGDHDPDALRALVTASVARLGDQRS